VQFSLDAARVARENDPGDLKGLATIKPGSRVWLMMYYTVSSLPRAATRITSYEVLFKGKTLYKVSYRGKMKAGETGRFSRYDVFSVPSSLAFGSYVFKAHLTIAKHQKTKAWNFKVGRQETPARPRSG